MRSPLSPLARARARHGAAQLVGGLAIWGVYLLITQGLATDGGGSNARGRSLLSAERWLHLDVELKADQWLARHDVLGFLAAWEYATTYILTTFLVLGWLWWRRPGDYVWGRNTLVWTTLIALACFAVWPTTPPRLLGAGYVDIVARFHPVLSWGGGVSASADQYAAMPSLHVGWAVWVTAVTVRAAGGRVGYALAVLHLSVTAAVVVATGNHYVLDVLAGFSLVWLATMLERVRVAVFPQRAGASGGLLGPPPTAPGAAGPGSGRAPGQRVAAADEFFLHVETATVPQPVGGFIMLDTRRVGGLTIETVRDLVGERLDRMPRFSQRLQPAGRFRHARWVPAEPDLDWHVREFVLPTVEDGSAGGGRAELPHFVSGLTERELSRDRPMWRCYFVPNVGPDEAMAIAVMHHAFADGLGVVDILRQLFEPALPPPDLSGYRMPPWPVRAAAAGVGLLQLAAEGTADRLPIGGPLTGRRRYRFAALPFDRVRTVATRAGARVTDVLLAATGSALAQVLADRGQDGRRLRLRVAVPVTTRLPAPPGTGRRAEPGNLTAALRLDVPLDPSLTDLERLRRTAAAAGARRRSGRALAAAGVIRAIGLLPPPLHRRLARVMYCGRFFTAIVSNMPGPSVELSLAGAPIKDVYPIIPLAEGVPLGVGTLGWNGQLCLSVITDVTRLPEAEAMLLGITSAIERMADAVGDANDRAGELDRFEAAGDLDHRGGTRQEVPSSQT